MNAIMLKDVQKVYRTGTLLVPVLLGIDLEVKKGEMAAIMGPSGSGKSTLMNIIGLLDRPSQGELILDDKPIDLSMPDSRLAKMRSQSIGFVFQSFNLLPRISALANVLLPASYAKGNRADQEKRAVSLLRQVGLAERMLHKPTELSGGEKQRVAIARALMNNPEIVLADEPTGNLDSKSGAEIMAILKDLNKKGKTIIVITHDPNIARQCDRIIQIEDGKVAGGVR